MIEIILSLTLLILLGLILNPFDFLMLTHIQMYILVGLILLFSLFAVFIFREKPQDEREILHRSVAGRYAYLLGATMLVVGISVQTFQHTLDVWLVITLAVMILTKIISLVYERLKS